MLHTTEVRVPHDATHIWEGGRVKTRIDDPRGSVRIEEDSATLLVFFEPEGIWTGKAPLLEVRLLPTAAGTFEPWRLMPRLPQYLQYARATLARDDTTAAIRALRETNSTRRGLNDDFLKLVAQDYIALAAEGEPYPVKTIAENQPVDKSTASRWITAARARGFLPAVDSEREGQS